jgi:hypothetical protein
MQPNNASRVSRIVIEPKVLAVFIRDWGMLIGSSTLSKAELARRTDHSQPTISKALSGVSCPPPTVVLDVVRECGGDVDEWRQRWHETSEATKAFREGVQREIVDLRYDRMTPPSTPYRFNQQLRKRISRDEPQGKVVTRAHYREGTASDYFNSNRIASAEFTDKVLEAAGASERERAAWLLWRSVLDGPEAPDGEGSAPKANPVGRQPFLSGLAVIMALVLAVTAFRSSPASDVTGHGASEATSAITHPASEPATAPATHRPTTPHGRPSTSPSPARPPAAAPPVASSTTTAPRSEAPHGPQPVTATIVGGAPSGGFTAFDDDGPTSGQQVKILCITTTTDPVGWYFVTDGYFVHPTSVAFSDEDAAGRVPACKAVDFPESSKAKCLVRLRPIPCSTAKARVADALR